MIKCSLSSIMGSRKLKIIKVAKLTGLDRNTITRLYNDEFLRIDKDTLNRLCKSLNVSVGDLLQYVED